MCHAFYTLHLNLTSFVLNVAAENLAKNKSEMILEVVSNMFMMLNVKFDGQSEDILYKLLF